MKKKRLFRGEKWRYGSVSALLLILLILSLIALNIGAEVLEKKNGWRRDYSFNSIATASRATLDLVDDLPHPVKIYALFRKGNEDAPLLELLDRYAALSSRITWEQADPGLNPALLSRFATESQTPEEDNLIIWCEETGRWRVLGPEDYVSLSMDETTGEYSYAGWTYEESITRAIEYVTRDTVPQVVIIQGHGELDGDSLAVLDNLLTANLYEVVYRSLTDPDYTPDPKDLLVFLSPLRDISETELKILTEFAAKGGSFLFACDFSDPVDSMPNYAALLRSYGFIPLEGIVLADTNAPETCYDGVNTYLLPEMCSTDITMDMIASGATSILLPGARGFESPDETDRNLITAALLRSGDTSYRKALDAQTVSMDRAEGDPQGPFDLALQARRITAEGYVSRAVVFGCSIALTDETVYSMTDIRKLIIRTTEFLLDTGASDLNIEARTALRPALGTGGTGLGSVMLAALPAAVLAAALLVLLPRRNR